MEQVEIKKLGINGEGIGYINDKVCFVKGALPGEVVEVYIDEDKRRYKTGHINRLIQPSSARVKVTCDEYETCMGCALLHMNYQDQLNAKREMIKEALQKYTKISLRQIDLKPVVGISGAKGYRQAIGFPIAFVKGRLSIGVYQRATKHFTFMNHCALQDPLINDTLMKIEDILNNHRCHDYNDKLKKGLRFIIVRKIADALQVIFVTGQDGIAKEVTDDIKKIKAIKGLFYTINTTKHQDFTLAGYKRIYGEGRLPYNFADETYMFSSKSDVIEHPEMFAREVDIVTGLVSEGDTVLSVGCGTGILEMQLPQNLVYGLDSSKFNISDADYNKEQLSKEALSFEAGRYEDLVPRYLKRRRFHEMILRLDKDGIHPNIVESLFYARLDQVILIGDLPGMMAKSIAALSDLYDVESIYPLDQAPYSAKVRMIVALSRKS